MIVISDRVCALHDPTDADLQGKIMMMMISWHDIWWSKDPKEYLRERAPRPVSPSPERSPRRRSERQVIIPYPVSRWFYFRTVSLAQEEITLTKEEVAITLAKEAEQKTEELLLSQVCLHIN